MRAHVRENDYIRKTGKVSDDERISPNMPIKNRRAEIVIFKIFAFFISYSITIANSTNFKNYCVGMFVIALSMLADFSDTLYKSKKNRVFYIVCITYLIYNLTIITISIMGLLGALSFKNSLLLCTANSQKIPTIINADFLSIYPFGLVFYYLLDWFGSLD